MARKYAIIIEEDTLDLIRFLNDGGEVKIEDEPTYFVLEVISPTESGYSEIKFENDLYDETGHLKDNLVVLQ